MNTQTIETTETNNREAALLQSLGLGEPGPEDLGIEAGWYENSFTVDGGEYLVLTDAEADEKAKEDIMQSLWAFNTDFILAHSKLPYEAKEMVLSFQENKCESANETIEAMIVDIDAFVEDAISADGRGHFLSPYDGNEDEITIDGETFYIYRQN